MLKKLINKIINDEFFISRTFIAVLLFLCILSALIIYDNPSVFSALLFLFCVYLSIQTYFSNRIYKAAAGLKVQDVMVPLANLTILKHSLSTVKALETVCKSYQQIYPVFYNNNFYGVLNKDKFLANLSSGVAEAYIGDFTEKKFEYVYTEEDLKKLLANGRLKDSRHMVVFDRGNNFCGLLSYEKLIEFLLIDKAIKDSKNREIQDEFWL